MDVLELTRRGRTGELLSKEDWDLDRVAVPILETVRQAGLKRPKGEFLLTDDATARVYFEAAVEYLSSAGVYDQSTGRVIRFTREEILEAALSARQEIPVGSGRDAFTFYARHPEDSRLPGVVAGNPGCPMTESLFRRTVASWACEPVVDMITCGSIVEVDGQPVLRASPAEVLAVRRELRALNEITQAVGRPGLGRLAAESSVSEIGDLAAMASGCIRSGDAHLVALNNELITNDDNLIRAVNGRDAGILNASLACVMVGGMAGGPEGATLCMIASMLAANLVCAADYHLCHPIHLTQIATSAPECMWLQSVVCRAFSLCAPAVIVCDIYPKSGAGTKELLYETAANALSISVSGGHLEGVGSCDGLKPNCSGLEARLMGEVGKAAAAQGMTCAQAVPILEALYEKYRHVLSAGNDGLPFEAVYGEDGKPRAFWLDMYREVRAELVALGIAL